MPILLLRMNHLTFRKQPYLRRSIGIHDTCGVHNLHGLPGIFSGIVAAIFAATAEISEYGDECVSVLLFLALQGQLYVKPLAAQ